MPKRKFRRKFARRSRLFRRFRRRVHKLGPEVKIQSNGAEGENFLPGVTTGTIDNCLVIGNGDSNTERIGNRIQIKSLHFRFDVLMDALSTQKHEFVRIAVVVDLHQVNGVAPTMLEVYESASNPRSWRQQQTTGNYRVLWTKTIMQTLAAQNAGSRRRLIKANISFKKPLVIRYATGTGTSVTSNGIWLMIQSNAIQAQATSVQMYRRVKFIDL